MAGKGEFPHQNVVWNSDTESYKIVENPSWDIEKKFQTYLELTQMGMDEKASSEIVKQFSMVKPVFVCYCPGTSIAASLEEHVDLRFAFMPCPCACCEEKAKSEMGGFDIRKPLASISLHEEIVTQMVLSMRDVCQVVLAEKDWSDFSVSWFSSQLVNSTDEFELFIKMLIRYGEVSHLTWSDVISEFENSGSIEPHFFASLGEFENHWISYHLHATT